MKIRSALFSASAVLALTASTSVATPQISEAAMPPANYPINMTMDVASTPKGLIQIRRGFYDAQGDKGFGYDKVRWKHNIWNMATIKWVMKSNHPDNKWVNGDYTQFAFFQKWNGRRLMTEVRVRAVSITNRSAKIAGRQTVSPVGLFTLYCDYGKQWELCPDWANNITSSSPRGTKPLEGGTEEPATSEPSMTSTETEAPLPPVDKEEPMPENAAAAPSLKAAIGLSGNKSSVAATTASSEAPDDGVELADGSVVVGSYEPLTTGASGSWR